MVGLKSLILPNHIDSVLSLKSDYGRIEIHKVKKLEWVGVTLKSDYGRIENYFYLGRVMGELRS